MLAWRNRQTRTAQDRMGQPVEVRVLSRALRLFNYFDFPAAFLLAAHRAFINCESFFRPAAVIPPFFLRAILRPACLPPFCLAQRARAAAANLARVAADTRRLPVLDVELGEVLPKREARRLSRLSICRRIDTACSKDLRDKSIRRLIAGIEWDSKQLFKYWSLDVDADQT